MNTLNTTAPANTNTFDFISRRVAMDSNGQVKLNEVLTNGLPESAIEFIDSDDKVTTIDNAKFWRRLPYSVTLPVPTLDEVLASELGKTKILEPLLSAHIFAQVRAAFANNLAISVPDSFTLSIQTFIESL